MKIALIQLSAGQDKEANIINALQLVEQAALEGARFILLPEVFSYRGQSKNKNLEDVSEKIPGAITLRMGKLAKKYKVFILGGSIHEKIAGSRKVYNTSFLLNSRGEVQSTYRKMNLFSAVLGKNKIQESDCFLVGKKAEMSAIDNFKIGMSICFDLRFPELYRQYFNENVSVIVVPSAFTKKTGEAHWEVLLRARAIENQCYVLAPNQIGADARGIESYGNSMVVDPWGKVIARASANKEEIVYADIDVKEIKRVKKILPMNVSKN